MSKTIDLGRVVGNSAYEDAVANGYVGTLQEWLASLKGEKGEQGERGIQGIQGERGLQGEQGIQGIQGVAGKDGKDGTNGQDGKDGKDGLDGQDGYSPTVAVAKSGKTTTITITDKNGDHTATITDGNDGQNGSDGRDGTNGQDGQDGVSPSVAVSTIQGGHQVTITDAEHPQGQSFNVMDGQDGGISDAPSDGKAYVRKDGEWVEGVEKSEVVSLQKEFEDLSGIIHYTAELGDYSASSGKSISSSRARLCIPSYNPALLQIKTGYQFCLIGKDGDMETAGGTNIRTAWSSNNYRITADTYSNYILRIRREDNGTIDASELTKILTVTTSGLVENISSLQSTVSSNTTKVDSAISDIGNLNNIIGAPSTEKVTIDGAGKSFFIPCFAKAGDRIRIIIDGTGVLNTSDYSPLYENSTSGASIARVYGKLDYDYTCAVDVTSIVIYVRSSNFIQAGDIDVDIRLADGLYNKVAKQEMSKSYIKFCNPVVDIHKNGLKILDLGNSFSDGALSHVADIVTNLNADVSDMCIYKVIRGGASFKSYCDIYHDRDTKTYTFAKVLGGVDAQTATGNGSIGDGSLLRQVLSEKWDIIIIHQMSTYSHDFSLWEKDGESGCLFDFLRILNAYQPQASIGTYVQHSSYQQSSDGTLNRWNDIAYSTALLASMFGMSIVIPYGTAVESIRQSSINTTDNGLSSDNHHLADGVGLWLSSATLYQALIAPRTGKSIIDCTYKPSTTEGTGVIAVTDANISTLKTAVISACCNRYEVVDADNINV